VTDVAIGLQNPGASSGYLLEVLLNSARGAERGGGIFAFATADGIKALLRDDVFNVLLKSGKFDLVVGVDSITDIRALDELTACSGHYHNLVARVFVHNESVLFHPKLSWFVAAGQLTLIIGSGNLTVRGLRENWEAFTIVTLNGDSAREVEAEMVSWLASHAALLYSPEDATARERAARNTGRERDLKHPKRVTKKDVMPVEASVLVAEVPRSGTRPSQVNFDKANYETFFGAKEGSEGRVTLRRVERDGTVGEAEIRPIMIRKSRNFSFELTGFREGSPQGQPPDIGIYVRLPQGTFLYQRVTSGEAGYAELALVLDRRWTGSARLKRRALSTVSEVRAAWPGSPLWTAEIPSS
jgi:HKD family nuclease